MAARLRGLGARESGRGALRKAETPRPIRLIIMPDMRDQPKKKDAREVRSAECGVRSAECGAVRGDPPPLLCCSLARAEGMAAEEAGERLPGFPQTASRAD